MAGLDGEGGAGSNDEIDTWDGTKPNKKLTQLSRTAWPGNLAESWFVPR